MDNFASLDTPGDPGGVYVVELSGMKPNSADSVTVILVIIYKPLNWYVKYCISFTLNAQTKT